MRHWLFAGIATFALAGAAAAQDRAATAMAAAMDAVRAGDYTEAATRAAPAGETARDIVEWHRLRAGQGTLGDYRSFIARHPDWPGMPLLREKGEPKLREANDPGIVIAYFDGAMPETGQGAYALNLALRAAGRKGEAEQLAIRAWTTMPLTEQVEADWLGVYPNNFGKTATQRLDMLLWRGLDADAERMLPRVDPGWQALARARMGLAGDAKGVDGLIAAVPAPLADDPGLAYERFAWRARKGRNADAVALMLDRSTSAERLGQPERWAGWRRSLARASMREGRAQEAYRIAASHHIDPEDDYEDYSDLEWLAGYVALRYLDDPATALTHFQRTEAAVTSPISLGRAGYWIGRAYEQMGQIEQARAAYARGGRHQTSFYGQLAAEKAGLPMDPALYTDESFPDWKTQSFANSSVLAAGILLANAGETALAARFFTHLAESLDRTQMGSLADLALAMDQPHIAVSVAKHAASRGIVIAEAYFPVTEIARARLPVPPELALAIARRESEFNPSVVSRAGARGLMQLMPDTAAEVSRGLGLDYSRTRLTADPVYNATLGSAYLAGLVQDFGAYPLVAAGYNAGPSRPTRWIRDYGDPRTDRTDAVDWVEHIPFQETQIYVMRVMESLAIYRARLSGKPQPLRLSQELKGR